MSIAGRYSSHTCREAGVAAIELAIGLPAMALLLGYGMALVLLAGSVSFTVDAGLQTALGVAAGSVSAPEDASAGGMIGYVIGESDEDAAQAQATQLSADIGAKLEAAKNVSVIASIAADRGLKMPGNGSSSVSYIKIRQTTDPTTSSTSRFEVRFSHRILNQFGIDMVRAIFSEMRNSTKFGANARSKQLRS